jgi:hypothetical protein
MASLPTLDSFTAGELLEFLPTEHRSAVLQQLLDRFVAKAVGHGLTIEQLVEVLPQALLWGQIKTLPASSLLRSIPATGTTAPVAATPPAPIKVKRGPERPRKDAATGSKAPKKAKKGKATFGPAEAERVLGLIHSKPGQHPSVYRAESKLPDKVFKNVLFKLKSDKKVKAVGSGRGTTYTA